jgi:hypothetical protein
MNAGDHAGRRCTGTAEIDPETGVVSSAHWDGRWRRLPPAGLIDHTGTPHVPRIVASHHERDLGHIKNVCDTI